MGIGEHAMPEQDVLRRILNESKKGVIIQIYVKPESNKEELVLEGGELVFYTTEPPEKGRANAALIRYLSKRLGIPVSKIDIISGQRDRLKMILIRDVKFDDIVELISNITEK